MTKDIFLFLGPILASIVTFFFSRRKLSVDVQSQELDNTAKIVKLWREMSAEMEARLGEQIAVLRAKNKELEEMICTLSSENIKLNEKMLALKEENIIMRNQLNVYKIFYDKTKTNEKN